MKIRWILPKLRRALRGMMIRWNSRKCYERVPLKVKVNVKFRSQYFWGIFTEGTKILFIVCLVTGKVIQKG